MLESSVLGALFLHLAKKCQRHTLLKYILSLTGFLIVIGYLIFICCFYLKSMISIDANIKPAIVVSLRKELSVSSNVEKVIEKLNLYNRSVLAVRNHVCEKYSSPDSEVEGNTVDINIISVGVAQEEITDCKLCMDGNVRGQHVCYIDGTYEYKERDGVNVISKGRFVVYFDDNCNVAHVSG